MRDADILFRRFRLCDALEMQKQKAAEAVERLPEKRLLGDGEELLCRLKTEFEVKPIELKVDGLKVSREETRVDVSRDQRRLIFDRSRPVYVPGTVIRYFVPFSGDESLFDAEPDWGDCNPPRGRVEKGELILSYPIEGDDIGSTKRAFDAAIARVGQYLSHSQRMVEHFNIKVLPRLLQTCVTGRRDRVQAAQKGLEDLGLPIRQT